MSHEPGMSASPRSSVTADGPGHSALAVDHVSKAFGATLALDDVSLEVRHGEVLALLGHNGSGKSTLIKILAGFHQPDGPAEGRVNGESFELGSAEEALSNGLRFVHQDLGLILELDAIDNVALVTGYLRARSGRIARGAMAARTRALLDRFNIELDMTEPLARATPVQRAAVAIARGLWDWDESARRVLVLDEPTAALPSREVDNLFALIDAVRNAGHGVIYVSHRMDEIFRVADRVVVLRSGRVVMTATAKDVTPRRLSEAIGGEASGSWIRQASVGAAAGDSSIAFSVTGLSGRFLNDVDVIVRAGEIVGFAGLQGSGREELPYLLAGAHPTWGTATWKLGGKAIDPPTSATAAETGIAFVPAERAREGLIAELTVRENLTLAYLPRLRRQWRLPSGGERTFAGRWLNEMGINGAVIDQPITALSGGNQQRVLLAKWLATEPRVLIVSEPTAGVDVGARHALYDLLRKRATRGLAVLVASSDVEDLVEACDRVVVLRDGRCVRELRGEEMQRSTVLSLIEQEPDVEASPV